MTNYWEYPKLPKECIEGAIFRVFFKNVWAGKGYFLHRIVHIRDIVDGMAVTREWSPAKQRWYYQVEDGCYFQVNKDHIYWNADRPKEEENAKEES